MTRFRCGRCERVQPVGEFSHHAGKRNSWCKTCHRDYDRWYYRKNPGRYRHNLAKGRRIRVELIAERKHEKQCRRCRRRFPYFLLDYDHIRDKSFSICRGVGNRKPITTLRREIAKCQLVCVNCHRELSQWRIAPGPRTVDKRRRMKRPDVLLIRALKELLPCRDCEKRYPYWVMDFDHVGEKGFAIRDLNVSRRRTLEELLHEISRCELVCANCHRIRTFVRRFDRGDRGLVAIWNRLNLSPLSLARRVA